MSVDNEVCSCPNKIYAQRERWLPEWLKRIGPSQKAWERLQLSLSSSPKDLCQVPWLAQRSTASFQAATSVWWCCWCRITEHQDCFLMFQWFWVLLDLKPVGWCQFFLASSSKTSRSLAGVVLQHESESLCVRKNLSLRRGSSMVAHRGAVFPAARRRYFSSLSIIV